MIMRPIRFILLLLTAVLLVGVSLLVFLPATTGLRWLTPRLGSLHFEGVAGTVWNGQAANVTFKDKPLGTLNWRIHPWPLLSRRLSIEYRLEGVHHHITGELVHSGDETRLGATTVSFPAEWLAPALDTPALSWHGTVELNLERGLLRNRFPVELQGQATWREASVSGATNAAFGDLIAGFNTSAAAIEGTAHDNGGPLALDGQFHADLSGYQVHAHLAARNSDPQVLEALRYIGTPAENGGSRLEISGHFLPLP